MLLRLKMMVQVLQLKVMLTITSEVSLFYRDFGYDGAVLNVVR